MTGQAKVSAVQTHAGTSRRSSMARRHGGRNANVRIRISQTTRKKFRPVARLKKHFSHGVDLDFQNSNKSKADAMRNGIPEGNHCSPSTEHQPPVQPVRPKSAAFHSTGRWDATPSPSCAASPRRLIGSGHHPSHASRRRPAAPTGAALTATVNPKCAGWAHRKLRRATRTPCKLFRGSPIAAPGADKADLDQRYPRWLPDADHPSDLREPAPGGGAAASPHETERQARRPWAERADGGIGAGTGRAGRWPND